MRCRSILSWAWLLTASATVSVAPSLTCQAQDRTSPGLRPTVAYTPFQSTEATEPEEDSEPMSQIEELVERLKKAEGAILKLEEQNEELESQLMGKDSSEDDKEENDSEDKEDGKDKEDGEKKEDEKKDDKEKKEDEKKEEKKDKKWYDKISLRGYAQLRYNYQLHTSAGSAPRQHPGDGSVSPDQEFFFRRARLILYGDVTDHLYLYMQPDFASTPNGSVDAIQFAQIRDWYGDVFLDTDKEHRFRVGQSKIPYGWENMQSSSNRLYLDRNDAFNSAARNERDLGVFYYWNPKCAQDIFKFISDEKLKGSGDYGIFGLGIYNGQGGSLREFNDDLHLIARLTQFRVLRDGQLIEFGTQAYTGHYDVLGANIAPLGVGPAVAPLGTRGRPTTDEGFVDSRIGWTFIYYPQPWGWQAEFTVGRGPELNAAQTAIQEGDLHGGYIMTNYRYKTHCHGEFWPFARWQYYRGGYKNAANAPFAEVNEWNLGVEWQIRPEYELVCEYLITDRTNLNAQATGQSYGQFDGQMLRFQFQFNF